MTTKDIIDIIHKQHGYLYSKKQTQFIVNQIFHTIIEGLKKDGKVTLRDFASFEVVKHKRFKTKRVKFRPSLKMITTIRFTSSPKYTLPTK